MTQQPQYPADATGANATGAGNPATAPTATAASNPATAPTATAPTATAPAAAAAPPPLTLAHYRAGLFGCEAPAPPPVAGWAIRRLGMIVVAPGQIARVEMGVGPAEAAGLRETAALGEPGCGAK
jgi:hypothetical protein